MPSSTKWNVVPPCIVMDGRGWWVSTNTGWWKGGSSPHQPVHRSPLQGPRIGPNMLRPMIVAALAVLRGDRDAGGVLLDYAGNAIMTTGVRTPVDIALYSEYLRRHGEAGGGAAETHRVRSATMSVSDAVALGLGASRPSA